jgi:gas vesicle protein
LYFSGVNPGDLGSGLNSVADQATGSSKENVEALYKSLKALTEGQSEKMVSMENVISSKIDNNNRLLETVSNQVAKVMEKIANKNFFLDSRPPKFK